MHDGVNLVTLSAMPDIVAVTLRIPVELHRALVEAAREEQRSLNGQILFMLRRSVDASR